MGRSIFRCVSRHLFAALMVMHGLACAAPAALPSYKVDIRQTSVSGLSSGAFMAVQFGVTWSSIVTGVGVIAGGPYYCAQGDLDIATRKCSCTSIVPFSCAVAPGATDVGHLIDITDRRAERGLVDRPANLARQRIWMFSGTRDSVVPAPVMDDLFDYYRHYIAAANIRYRKGFPAEHTMPTESYGNGCTTLGSPYIGRCGLDAAGALLQWIYGDTLQPKQEGRLRGSLIEFDQAEFVDDRQPARHGLADSGYAYVPADCAQHSGPSCRLHIAFHGCLQDAGDIGEKFVRNAGYNPWADTNRIIVLYPQTRAEFASNPNACWNWFDADHDDPGYADRRGIQIRAVRHMVDRVVGVMARPALSSDCFTASNAQHVAAGRAYDWFFLARAKGSEEFLGPDTIFWSSSLKRNGTNYHQVASCP